MLKKYKTQFNWNVFLFVFGFLMIGLTEAVEDERLDLSIKHYFFIIVCIFLPVSFITGIIFLRKKK
jgi:hypothetical protein